MTLPAVTLHPWMGGVIFVYALLEWWLPRTEKVQARSVIEALCNGIGVVFPFVKTMAGTPKEETILQPDEDVK